MTWSIKPHYQGVHWQWCRIWTCSTIGYLNGVPLPSWVLEVLRWFSRLLVGYWACIHHLPSFNSTPHELSAPSPSPSWTVFSSESWWNDVTNNHFLCHVIPSLNLTAKGPGTLMLGLLRFREARSPWWHPHLHVTVSLSGEDLLWNCRLQVRAPVSCRLRCVYWNGWLIFLRKCSPRTNGLFISISFIYVSRRHASWSRFFSSFPNNVSESWADCSWIDWLIDWLVDWLIGWLIGCLVAWLIGWLVWFNWLIVWLDPWYLYPSFSWAGSKTPVILLCRSLVIRTSGVRKTQVGVSRRKLFIR